MLIRLMTSLIRVSSAFSYAITKYAATIGKDFAKIRKGHDSSIQPSCATKALKRRFHFFIDSYVAVLCLIESAQLVFRRPVYPSAARFDLASQFRKLVLILLRPSLNPTQDVRRCLGHVNIPPSRCCANIIIIVPAAESDFEQLRMISWY
jgi:hypothetical protein